jgi:hypothetical protein
MLSSSLSRRLAAGMALVGALQLTTAFDPAGISLRLALPRVAPRASCLVLRRPSSSSGGLGATARMQDNNAEGTIPGTWCLTAAFEEVSALVASPGSSPGASCCALSYSLALRLPPASPKEKATFCLIRGIWSCAGERHILHHAEPRQVRLSA